MPDSPPLCTGEADRHVRFTSAVRSPHPSSVAYEAGPSRPRDIPKTHASTSREPALSSSSEKHVSGSQSSSVSPLRSRGVPSVKDAVSRFRIGEDDADVRILLPKEAVVVSPGKGKGKEKEAEKGRDVKSVHLCLLPSREKGNQHSQEPECADTSKEIRMRGKERGAGRGERRADEEGKEVGTWDRDKDKDLDERRREDEKEREKDKERIKMLEEEIRRLNEEVCLSQSYSSMFF